MSDLPTGIMLIVMGVVAPDGYRIVTCPWEQVKTIYEPRYVDNMPIGNLSFADLGMKPNPNFIEYRCVMKADR